MMSIRVKWSQIVEQLLYVGGLVERNVVRQYMETVQVNHPNSVVDPHKDALRTDHSKSRGP